MKEETERICERIRMLIERQDLSYAELAVKSGVPKSAIHRYATGQTTKIPMDRIMKLASVLNTSAAWIMGWEEKEPPETDGKAFLDGLSEDELQSVKSYVQFLLSQRNQ